ncbi:MAG: polysaccharide deacetylase family protein [Myxococcota bacterium]
MSRRPRAVRTAISVDLDDIGCYHAIHGLPPPSADHAGVVLERCLPRFLELFHGCGVRATFFVIGRDLQRDLDANGRGAALLREAAAAGHELGNHSHAHAYDLTRWSAERQRQDLEACHALVSELGPEPVGFRAPGYTHDRQLLSVVSALGYRYDSSALPSPPYYAAKVAVIGAMRIVGRRSESLATGAASFLGPRKPHRVPDLDLWELPISVGGALRWPLIGTTVLGQLGILAAPLRRKAGMIPFLTRELHGLDLADPDVDGFSPALRRVQPELKTPLAWRRARLQELLVLRGGGRPLREALPG